MLPIFTRTTPSFSVFCDKVLAQLIAGFFSPFYRYRDPLALTLSSLTAPLLVTTTLLLASFSDSAAGAASATWTPIEASSLKTPIGPSVAVALLTRLSTAAAISSGTLLLTFFFGLIRQFLPSPTDDGGGYAPRRRKSCAVPARDVALRVAAVLACYFASLELGGVRAAAVVLACLAAGLHGVGIGGLSRRKAVLGAIAAAVAWDMWRGIVRRDGGLGTLVAYAALLAGAVALRSPWAPETKFTPQQFNRVSLLAACTSGALALLGWLLFGSNAALPGITDWDDAARLQLLACVVGAVGMVLDSGGGGGGGGGGGARADAAYAAGISAAIAGAWAFGTIDGYEVLSEAGLAALALAGMYRRVHCNYCSYFFIDSCVIRQIKATLALALTLAWTRPRPRRRCPVCRNAVPSLQV